MFILDNKLNLLDINPAAANLIDIESSEYINKSIYALFNSRPGIETIFEGIDREETGEIALNLNGEQHYFLRRVAPLFQYSRQRGRMVIISDITKRKQTELALLESDEWLRNILRAIQAGVFVIDARSRRITNANPFAAELCGVDRDRLIGAGCRHFLCPSQDGICPVTDQGKYIDGSESILRQASGKYIPVLRSVKPITIGGRPHLVESFIDIRARKLAEDELRRHRDHLEELVEERTRQLNDLNRQLQTDITHRKHAEEIIQRRLQIEHCIAGISSQLAANNNLDVAINNALADISQLCGASRSYLFLLNQDGRYASNTHEWCAPGIEPKIKQRRHINIEKMEVLNKTITSGEIMYIPDISRANIQDKNYCILSDANVRSVIALPVHINARVAGFIGVDNVLGINKWSPEDLFILRTAAEILGYTLERCRSQQELISTNRKLEEANQAKSLFLAQMSHELRTPLNAMIGFSEILIDEITGEINPEQRSCLEDIHSSGQHLLTLVSGVLDLAKVEAGKMEIEIEDMVLKPVIDNAVKLIKPIIDSNQHQLEMDLPEYELMVKADRKRLTEILFNLLSNAVKFTPTGGKLRISVEILDNYCQISVSDTGIGIRPEHLPQVFDAFTQMEALPDRNVQGTGLGLKLCRQFTEMMGGTIWAESDYGRGSVFHFTLPLASKTSIANVTIDTGNLEDAAVNVDELVIKPRRNKRKQTA